MLTFVRFLLGFMLVLTSLFLILLVLIQRGRGGGLTGALGGAGGQSAFGTKAGDVFTRITVGVAAFWIGLCILSLNMLGQQQSLFSETLGGSAPQAIMPQTPPAGGDPTTGGTSADAGAPTTGGTTAADPDLTLTDPGADAGRPQAGDAAPAEPDAVQPDAPSDATP